MLMKLVAGQSRAQPEAVRRGVSGLAVIAAVLSLGLGGCSSIPWFGDSGNTAKSESNAGKERVPGDKGAYPNLATVPDRPKPETTKSERQAIAQGLVADRAHAQYTDQELRAREPVSVAPPPAPPPAPPAPKPMASTTTASPKPASAAAPTPPPATSAAPAPATPMSEESKPQMAQSAMPASGNAAAPPPSPPTAAPKQSMQSGGALPSLVAGGASAAPPPPPPPPPAAGGYSENEPLPEIVQPTDTPAPPMHAGEPPPAPSAPPAGSGSPPYPNLGVSQSTTSEKPAGTAPMASASTSAPASAPVTAPRNAAPAAPPMHVPMIDLPVTRDQATLEETFSRSIAEQNSMTVASAAREPVSAAPAGPAMAPPQAGPVDIAPGQVTGTPAVVIKFGHGVSGLSAAAKRQLQAFAPKAKQYAGTIRIIGHASRRTGEMSYAKHLASNFNVSVDRANAVARELAALGVDPAHMKIEAVGESMPVFRESMPSGEAENRRVEIYLE